MEGAQAEPFLAFLDKADVLADYVDDVTGLENLVYGWSIEHTQYIWTVAGQFIYMSRSKVGMAP